MTISKIKKSEVKRCFNKAFSTYDANCHAQRAVGQKLIYLLKNHSGNYKKIIDLGCGTGLITKELSENFFLQQLTAIDIAPHLLAIAKLRLEKNVEFIEADFDQLSLSFKSYDLIFSNMSLQWSNDLSTSSKIMYQHLSSKGLFAFSLPLIGTFHELQDGHVNVLPTDDGIVNMLAAAGFKLLVSEIEENTFSFPTQLAAIQSIKKTGASYLPQKKQKGLRGRDNFVSFFKIDQPPFSLTYRIGYFIAEK